MELMDKVKYKQTEVGLIPEDWLLKKISEISNPVRGGSPRPAGDPKYFNGNFIPWVTVASLTNISNSQLFVSETEAFLTELGSKYSRTLEKDSLIIANSGATLGVAKILSMKCCANDGIAILLDIDNDIDKIFIVYFINTKTKYLREVVATGNGQPNLNTELIGNILIPLPPTRTEQTAIATALSDADALISSLEKLIAKKRNIKQGTMQKLLTPQKGWKVITYGDAFDFLSTASYSREELSVNNEVQYIHYGDIHTKWNDFLDFGKNSLPTIDNLMVKNYSLIKDGDIIMADASEDYAGVGKSIEVKNIREKKVISGLHTFLLRDNSGIFANGFKGYIHLNKIVKKQLDKLATGLKVYSVSKTALKTIEIPYPSTKEEQTAIAHILSDMDEEITALETKLDKYKMLKQGMMQKLLTGKIRLI